MNYRTLGKTGIRVSEIGLGCWTLGGLNWVNGVPNGWANVDEKEIAEAVEVALERGVTHFDNADVYGNGRAERMLAAVLGNRIRQVVVATKVGHFPGTAPHAYDPLHIRHQCEQSLKNLHRDYIDLYYFHHADFGASDALLDDAVAMMRELKREGKIRAVGQSAYTEADFLRVVPNVQPDVVQANANILNTTFIADGSPVRRLMEERGISFVAFGPLAQGILLGKYSSSNPPAFEPGDHRANAPRFTKENLARVEPALERLKQKFGSDPASLSRAALQFLLAHPVVASVIPGFRNPSQVRINLAGADSPLTDAESAFVHSVSASVQR